MKKFSKDFIIKTWIPILILSILLIYSRKGNNPFFPNPVEIIKTSFNLINYNWVSKNLLPSLISIIFGFMLGSLLAITFGVTLTLNEKLRTLLMPNLNFLRSIPSVAKIPVVIAFFGIGLNSRIVSISLAAFFPVLLSTLNALITTNKGYLELAQISKLSHFQIFRYIKFPAGLNEIQIGLKVGLQISILIMITSEFIGAGFGVGAFIIHSQSTFKFIEMWQGVIIAGFLSIMLNNILDFIFKKIKNGYFIESSI